MKLPLLFLVSLTACDGGDTDAHDHDDHSHDIDIPFFAKVGDQDFACGRPYAGLGATATTWTGSDLRFYVHDFRAVTEDGTEVPMPLLADGAWQTADVALLDFEDRTETCANGTAETRAVVRVSVPHGTFTGVRFRVGVPFAVNHGDVAVAPSPLNLSSMFWNWQGGYKFIRLEGASTGLPGVVLHLGSTGCTADADGAVTSCANPNRAEVFLDGADPYGSTPIVFDVAALYAGVDLDTNGGGPPGCMAGPDDPDCAGVFGNLGLPFGQEPAGDGQVFRVE